MCVSSKMSGRLPQVPVRSFHFVRVKGPSDGLRIRGFTVTTIFRPGQGMSVPVLWVVAVGPFVIAPLLGFVQPHARQVKIDAVAARRGGFTLPLRVIEPFLVEPKCVFYPVFLAIIFFCARHTRSFEKSCVCINQFLLLLFF